MLLRRYWMGGVPILSVIAAYHFRHGGANAADVLLAAFADDTALGHPIYWCPFSVVDVIGLALPTNVEDGLRWWNSFVVLLLEHFFWIFVPSKSFRETVFLAEVYFFLSSLFHYFGGLLLGALFFFCIVRLVSFRVSSSISHFVFPLHGYAMNCGGVLVYSRRYPKY